MANCQFEKSGRNFTQCVDHIPFKECTMKINGDEWTSYQAFYNHVDNMCFFYKSEVWQENSEKLFDIISSKTSESWNLMY